MVANYLFQVVWALAVASRTASAFNVDMTTASLRNGAADSMFGFTIAQHVDQGQSWSVFRDNFYFVCICTFIRHRERQKCDAKYRDRPEMSVLRYSISYYE